MDASSRIFHGFASGVTPFVVTATRSEMLPGPTITYPSEPPGPLVSRGHRRRAHIEEHSHPVAGLCGGDLYSDGTQFYLRFDEKGGKARTIPVRHDLLQLLEEYLDRAGLTTAHPDTPLFCTARGRSRKLTTTAMSGKDIANMARRRYRDAGLPPALTAHSLRATTATALIDQGVPIEDVQHLLGHSDPRTTKLYDHTKRQVTRNIVERIPIKGT